MHMFAAFFGAWLPRGAVPSWRALGQTCKSGYGYRKVFSVGSLCALRIWQIQEFLRQWGMFFLPRWACATEPTAPAVFLALLALSHLETTLRHVHLVLKALSQTDRRILVRSARVQPTHLKEMSLAGSVSFQLWSWRATRICVPQSIRCSFCLHLSSWQCLYWRSSEGCALNVSKGDSRNLLPQGIGRICIPHRPDHWNMAFGSIEPASCLRFARLRWSRDLCSWVSLSTTSSASWRIPTRRRHSRPSSEWMFGAQRHRAVSWWGSATVEMQLIPSLPGLRCLFVIAQKTQTFIR